MTAKLIRGVALQTTAKNPIEWLQYPQLGLFHCNVVGSFVAPKVAEIPRQMS